MWSHRDVYIFTELLKLFANLEMIRNIERVFFKMLLPGVVILGECGSIGLEQAPGNGIPAKVPGDLEAGSAGLHFGRPQCLCCVLGQVV